MCLMRLNQTTIDALNELARVGENKKQSIEKKLFKFADDANAGKEGPFDNHSGSLRHMPPDLHTVRHYYIGNGARHRIYLTGSHKHCFYSAWYVKIFKKSGRDTEGGDEFCEKLRKALANADRFGLVFAEGRDKVDIEEGDNDFLNSLINPPADPPEEGQENQSPADSQ